MIAPATTGSARRWTRQQRRRILPLILAAVVFFVGGYAALQDGELLVGVTDIVAGLLNLGVILLARRSSRLATIVVNVVNALVALVLVVTSVQAGKQYIQYAWGFAMILFVVVAVAAYRRDTGS